PTVPSIRHSVSVAQTSARKNFFPAIRTPPQKYFSTFGGVCKRAKGSAEFFRFTVVFWTSGGGKKFRGRGAAAEKKRSRRASPRKRLRKSSLALADGVTLAEEQ